MGGQAGYKYARGVFGKFIDQFGIVLFDVRRREFCRIVGSERDNDRCNPPPGQQLLCEWQIRTNSHTPDTCVDHVVATYGRRQKRCLGDAVADDHNGVLRLRQLAPDHEAAHLQPAAFEISGRFDPDLLQQVPRHPR